MKHLLVGRSPLTTIAGYLVAILTSIHQANATGGLHNWEDFLLPAAIALFGRIAGDDKRKCPPAPENSPLPDEPKLPIAKTTDFLRRGRQHRQRRGHNGQFVPSMG